MDMETTPISRILLKLSPPVMLSLLIQSIYNIVDSFFVARYSVEGLTALSLIYPMQLLMIALATGTGAGVNILISRLDGLGETEKQRDYIRTGLILAMINFVIFAVPVNLLTGSYFHIFPKMHLYTGRESFIPTSFLQVHSDYLSNPSARRFCRHAGIWSFQ